ncbi:MAG: ankyrin repeat domain-containing protein [Blastocatellia bacterium]|nr:ankyrin repeat domain-containing protein [Blastocatellia bacterium]
MRVRARWLFCLWGALIVTSLAQTANLNEELLAAARKGNAEAIKSLLAKGADINAKSPYGATPLFFACDRGNAEVVKLLLDAGAEVNVRDTFYKSTPLTWAIQRDHGDVVKLLIEKSPQLKESATAQSVMQGQAKTAVVLLEMGGFKPESLSMWLSMAEKNGAAEIVEALKKAGAKPKPKTEFKLDPEQLKRYEGTFKNEQIELVVKIKDGRLIGSANGSDLPMNPTAEHTFEPEGQPMTVTFKLEGGKVSALALQGPGGETLLKKVEGK